MIFTQPMQNSMRYRGLGDGTVAAPVPIAPAADPTAFLATAVQSISHLQQMVTMLSKHVTSLAAMNKTQAAQISQLQGLVGKMTGLGMPPGAGRAPAGSQRQQVATAVNQVMNARAAAGMPTGMPVAAPVVPTGQQVQPTAGPQTATATPAGPGTDPMTTTQGMLDQAWMSGFDD